jgi:hypothetical protein
MQGLPIVGNGQADCLSNSAWATLAHVVPDYSFDLDFPAAARGDVLTALARMCTPDTAVALESARGGDHEATVDVILALSPDPVLTAWRQDQATIHVGVPAGEVRIGYVTVWIKPDTNDRVCITLWPVTRRMQLACLNSPTFRRALVDLLTVHQGFAGYLDRGDGSIVELWPDNLATGDSEYERGK